VSIRWSLGIASVALACFGAAAPATVFAQGACSGGGRMSKQIAKPMLAAQVAMKANRWQEVLKQVREAENTPGAPNTAFDQFYAHEFSGFAYSQLKQYPEAARELEAGLKSPCMAEAKKYDRYKALTGVYYALKNNAKVIEYGNLALKSGPDGDTPIYVAQAYYQTGDNKNAIRVMNETIAAAQAKGQAPKENWLLMLVSACTKVGDEACKSRQFEQLVTHYPKPDYWRQLTSSLTAQQATDHQTINIMRLATQVDVMSDPERFKEYAQLAIEQGVPCEAQTALEGAFAKNVFKEQRDKDVNTRLLTSAKTACAPAKAGIAAADAAAKAGTVGDADVKVGASYLSLGDYPKAAEAIQRGITKGKLTEPDEAYILLGISQLRANNKAAAAQAFRQVKVDKTYQRIAKLWLLKT
jgi:tetratricopeptide (TPR) repeat protein